VVRVALLPLLDAEPEVVVVFLGENRARLFVQLCSAGDVGQNRMLDDVLMNRLDERVIGNSLNEDVAVVVARRGGDIDLQSEAAVLLKHAKVYILDGLEPRHAGIVDVVRLVVENGQLFDFADQFAQVGLAVGRLADGLGTERIEK
jgi:hypothetical protein